MSTPVQTRTPSLEAAGSPRGAVSARLLIAGAVAWLAALASVRPLIVPDEGRYTDIARWMLESGDWLIPRLNGLPFLHKPPLYFWIEGAAIAVFGHHAFVYRLASLASGALILWCVHALTKRFSGAVAARWAVLTLALNPLFYIAAQFANLDLLVAALMTAVITLSVLAFADPSTSLRRVGDPGSSLRRVGDPSLSLRRVGDEEHSDRRLLIAAYAVAGLGVLAKGLIGCVIPGLVFCAYALVKRRPDWLMRAISPIGLVMFLAIVAPWFLAMERTSLAIPGGFTRYFIVTHHVQRYVTTGFNEHHGLWFYPVVLLGGTLPWSGAAIGEAIRQRALPGWGTLAEGQKLGLVWLIAVVVFFSLPASKLTGYSFIGLPAIALILGPFVAGYRWRMAAAWIGAGLCLFAVFAMPGYLKGIGIKGVQKATPIALIPDVRRLMGAGDTLVFYGEYWPDCAVALDRRQPIPVVGDWSQPSADLPDNQRRQLTEGGEFEPAAAGAVLIGVKDLGPILARATRTFVLAGRNSYETDPQLQGLETLAQTPRYLLLAPKAR